MPIAAARQSQHFFLRPNTHSVCQQKQVDMNATRTADVVHAASRHGQ